MRQADRARSGVFFRERRSEGLRLAPRARGAYAHGLGATRTRQERVAHNAIIGLSAVGRQAEGRDWTGGTMLNPVGLIRLSDPLGTRGAAVTG